MDSRSDQGLRRAVSDVYIEINKVQMDQDTGSKMDEVEKAECRCCGLNEDCTPDYIKRVKDSHCGHWVCGLCSEAVKEKLSRVPISTMEEALCAHAEICQKFNTTTRLNPKLSLAWAMRDIAKKKSQQRVPPADSKMPSTSKIARTSSCFAKIDLE